MTRYTQPQSGPYLIDWGNPLLEYLDSVWINGNHISRNGSGPATVGTSVTSKYGVGSHFNGTSQSVQLPNNAFNNGDTTTKFGTRIAVLKIGAAAASNCISGSGSGKSSLRVNSGGSLSIVVTGVSVVYTSAAIVSANELCVLGVATDGITNGSPVSVYKNGVSVASGTTSNNVGDNGPAAYIGQNGAGAQWWDGDIYLHLAFSRSLPDYELAALTANPWQIFSDEDTSWLYTTGGGGGTTYTLSVGGSFVLSGVAIYSHERQQVPSGSVTFSGSSFMVRNRVIIPTGSVTFSGSATEIKNKVIPAGGTVNFSGTAPLINPNAGTTVTTWRTMTGAGF